MRLWHYELIPHLPRQQLLGQHRECCALRGNGWGKKHSTVDYVFNHSPAILYLYHLQIMLEMELRGYNADVCWKMPLYRGKKCPEWGVITLVDYAVYPEHDNTYLKECLNNLLGKGIDLRDAV